jgi:hypothetical protein
MHLAGLGSGHADHRHQPQPGRRYCSAPCRVVHCDARNKPKPPQTLQQSITLDCTLVTSN